MDELQDEFYIDFTGGVRNDKSDLTKNVNEIVEVLNFDLRQLGRAEKRRGSHQFGDTHASNIGNSVYWERTALGSTPNTFHIINNNDSPALTRKIVGTRLTAAVSAGDTTITVVSTALFDSSGDIEIEGDLIAYTAKTATTFTTASGALAHDNNNAVHQLDPLDASPNQVDGRSGVYYATLNNLLFINGRAGSATFDGTDETFVADADEPGGLFATTYRQRIYVIGSGIADGAGARNGSPIRVSFSNPGDPTAWELTDFFDVEDERGEAGTGLLSSPSDELLIFKRNSFYSYNEVQLKQRDDEVGAYNNAVVQEIDGTIFTFCPAGVYETNGRSVNKISEPVQDYLKDFIPVLDSTAGRVVTNTFAARFDKKYILYIGDIESVDSINDVVLVFDTVTRGWTVWNGFTNFQHLKGLKTFKYENVAQGFEGLFGGDSSGKYYRFFSKRYRDVTGVSRFLSNGDLFEDLVSDTGVPITASLQTKLYDLGLPHIYKQFKTLRVLSEGAGFQIAYRLENEKRTN